MAFKLTKWHYIGAGAVVVTGLLIWKWDAVKGLFAKKTEADNLPAPKLDTAPKQNTSGTTLTTSQGAKIDLTNTKVVKQAALDKLIALNAQVPAYEKAVLAKDSGALRGMGTAMSKLKTDIAGLGYTLTQNADKTYKIV